MNPKRLVDKLLHQWPAKVICLIIAIFLYVFNQVSLIAKKTFVVPLTIQENGLVMHVGNVPNSVAVNVRASNENINLITINDINASINLDTITQKGVYELPVIIKVSENLQALDPMEVKLKDEKIIVEVDNRDFKFVNVEPSIVGEVSHGYEIEKVEISPSTIMITGPKTILDSLDKIYTKRVNVSNAVVSFTTDTSIQNINKLISVNEEDLFKTSITVVPQNMERIFSVPVDFMNLPTNLKIEGLQPTVQIKLLGTVVYLEDYQVPQRSVQAYLSEITEPGTYELPLHFYFPSTVEITEKSSDTITVTLVENKLNDDTQNE